MSAVTPLQSLRRLVDVVRLIDADECPELYNQLQAEITVAGAVLTEPVKHADDFAHFLSYSGLSGEPADVLEKMRRAFEAAQTAEVARNDIGQREIDYRHLNLDTLEYVESRAALIQQIGLGGTIRSFVHYPHGVFVVASLNDFTEVQANLAAKKIRDAAPLPEEGSAAQDARDAANLPEKMAPEMREAMWDAITRHGSSNLEYWIEDLYNDIRIAAMALEKK